MVLKRGANGKLNYNTGGDNIENAVEHKTKLEEFVETSRSRRGIVRKLEASRVMIDTTENKALEWEDENGDVDPELLPGLSPNEIRVLRGVLNPSDAIDTSTRIGSNEALQIEAHHFSETIGYTERELDRTTDPAAREALEERIEV